MSMRVAVSVVGIVLVGALWSDPVRSQAQAPPARGGGATPAPATAKPAGPAPWPTAAVLAERKSDAEKRPLFQSAEPLEITLTSDFRGIDRDRDPASTKTFPGTLTFKRPDGTEISKALQVRGRGHSRRNPKICDFSPLRLEFQKDELAGTVFAGHNALKLGAHCRSNAVFEQYVLREYTAYRIMNLLSPRSFRARLAKATYVESSTKKPLATRYGVFIEDDDDVARRQEGRITEQREFRFRHLEPEYLTLVTLFEYMIGNTDVSIYSQHNVKVVETQEGKRYPVPYDFDYSGLVNTTYAVFDKNLFHIQSVRDRVYRGPCRPMDQLEPYFVKLRATKSDIMALYDALPDFSDSSRSDAKSYLEQFFKTIDTPNEAKRVFVDNCVKEGMM